MHVMKGVGCVRFQLELGGFLALTRMLFVPGLIANVLLVSTLEDVGYVVLFQDGHLLLYLGGATLDATIELGIRQGQSYRLLRQPVGISEGILDAGSMSIAKRE